MDFNTDYVSMRFRPYQGKPTRTEQEIFDRAYLGVIKRGKPMPYRLKDDGQENGQFHRTTDENGNLLLSGVAFSMTEEEAAIFDNEPYSDNSVMGLVDSANVGELEYDLPEWIQHEHPLILISIDEAEGYAGWEYDNWPKNKRDEWFIETFKENMANVAEEHNLTVPEIPQ